MKIHLKQGWRLAVKHFYIVVLLFLYQLIWGFFLYRFIDSVVAPLLRRYPSSAPSEAAVQLFMTEAQFQLFKTDLINPYVWTLGGLLVARMLITPLFNAGLFYSLNQTRSNGGTRFLEGIRKAWKPVVLLYWIEVILSVAPAWYVLPRSLDALLESGSIPELLQTVLPGALLWLLWGTVLHLLFLAMQFSAASGGSIFRSLWHALRNFLTYAAVSLIMWGIGAAAGLVVTSLSMLWAGLFALILHQGYYLIQTLMKVWTIAAQYDFLETKRM
ncbi:hypothetical protein BK120_32235 [Paenibacillus sp. FSL A5-0031]|uniref:hypothetical protein n=1 Tax=Paenibacillus sp. FSL A5-0031 TaxID=1920420 RepID=UPI00096F0C09|nr:hypothetical protein [Paenibacillus sp. FSL A5-0031]OME74037.1 hypothetical protein BK120_32235 [Paenibacillus sp. FSL A5-0031]